jgi:hypothetical protein
LEGKRASFAGHLQLLTIVRFLVVFVCSGYVNAFGVYQDVYTRNGAGKAELISWIGSVQFFLSYALGYPVGLLMDKGYFRWVNFVGSFIFCLS